MPRLTLYIEGNPLFGCDIKTEPVTQPELVEVLKEIITVLEAPEVEDPDLC